MYHKVRIRDRQDPLGLGHTWALFQAPLELLKTPKTLKCAIFEAESEPEPNFLAANAQFYGCLIECIWLKFEEEIYVCFTQGHGSWSSRVFCPSVTQTDIQWMVHITQTSIESIKHFHLFVREKERGCLFWCVKKNVSGGTVWKAEKLFWMEKNQFVTHTPKFSQYKCQGMIYWK